MVAIAQMTPPFWTELLRTILLDVPYNTSLVLRSVAVLGAACGGVGVLLLLRKRSMVADALAHATLPGVCAGFLLALAIGESPRSLAILLPGAAIAGALGVACIHALNSLPRVREDASIGVVISVFFAVGIVLLGVIQNLNIAQKSGINSFIFGQAATMSVADGRMIMIVAAASLIVLLAFLKELRLLCFDAAYADALGFRRALLDGILMGLVTLLTIVGLHAVGALLMVALLIIPAASARFWSDRLVVLLLAGSVIGATGAYFGAAASAVASDVPTGAAIVVTCGLLFLLSLTAAPKRGVIMAAARHASLGRQIQRQHLLRAMFERGEITGNASAPVHISELHARRHWSMGGLRRVMNRALKQGELRREGRGYVLTERGGESASRIVRTHRLWEHYMTTQADVAPDQVDRAVDDIEHVLGEEIVMELERSLIAKQAIAREAAARMPASPHALEPEPAARERPAPLDHRG